MASTTSLMVASACSATCRSRSIGKEQPATDRAPAIGSFSGVWCGQCQRPAATLRCPPRGIGHYAHHARDAPGLTQHPLANVSGLDEPRGAVCLATDACAGTSHKVGI